MAPKGNDRDKTRKDGGHVQNKDNGAVAENRSAADEIAGDDFAGQSLDDQLLFADHAIDHQTKTLLRNADDDHETLSFFAVRHLHGVNAAQVLEAHESKNLIAKRRTSR